MLMLHTIAFTCRIPLACWIYCQFFQFLIQRPETKFQVYEKYQYYLNHNIIPILYGCFSLLNSLQITLTLLRSAWITTLFTSGIWRRRHFQWFFDNFSLKLFYIWHNCQLFTFTSDADPAMRFVLGLVRQFVGKNTTISYFITIF